MRALTRGQKILLKRWFETGDVLRGEDLSGRQWGRLEAMHDTEVLFQNVYNYLSDLQERAE